MPTACIFDVAGIPPASPHERAWREALQGFADPARIAAALHQSQIAGKPQLASARAAFATLGVVDAARQAIAFAERKQARLAQLRHRLA